MLPSSNEALTVIIPCSNEPVHPCSNPEALTALKGRRLERFFRLELYGLRLVTWQVGRVSSNGDSAKREEVGLVQNYQRQVLIIHMYKRSTE
jgi:hypothetical protein